MFERLLVPLDGSEQAEATLPYAEELAARIGSEVVLLQVGEPERECSGTERQSYLAYLDRLARTVRRMAAVRAARNSHPERREVRVQTVVLQGNPAERITEYAAGNAIGLIVMAAHGRSGLTRWAVGSVADKVLRAARIPIALITGPARDVPTRDKGALDKALLPLDGSKIGEAALEYVEELAPKMGTELTLLQVVEHKYVAYSAEIGGYIPYPQEWLTATEDAARSYLAGVEARLKAKGITVSSRVEIGLAADTIVDVAEKMKADFIAMSTHGRSGMGRWVFGSVADRVIHAGKMPVFLVRARPEEGK